MCKELRSKLRESCVSIPYLSAHRGCSCTPSVHSRHLARDSGPAAHLVLALQAETAAVPRSLRSDTKDCNSRHVAQSDALLVCNGITVAERSALAEYLQEEWQSKAEFVSAPSYYEELAGAIQMSWPSSSRAADAAEDASLGRTVLLLGAECPDWFPSALQEAMDDLGVEPAVYAVLRPQHEALPLSQVLRALRKDHARHFRLRQPLATLPGCGVPPSATVAMNLLLDHGTVPSPHSSGGTRPDASHVVVLDGMFDEEERRLLLAWLTAPDWDQGQGPPEERWERACVDRPGDSATWGLRPAVLRALRHDPPPQVLALQSRLAQLYPEFEVCHMPGAALEDGNTPPAEEAGHERDGEMALTAFVANAVTTGEAYHWHLDADPSTLPPDAPWRAHYGAYVNREPLKPLFVSALIYLDAEWPEDFDAETLFLDPATATGVFVRPAAGRMVLMDQDIPHRISAPSPQAGRPRYSLVWKLVFFPRAADTSPGAGGTAVGAAASLPALNCISRPEWGPPVRFGSAAAGTGVAAVGSAID